MDPQGGGKLPVNECMNDNDVDGIIGVEALWR